MLRVIRVIRGSRFISVIRVIRVIRVVRVIWVYSGYGNGVLSVVGPGYGVSRNLELVSAAYYGLF